MSDEQPKIDKGIPIPPMARAGRKGRWPFEQMQPGDSFFVPGKKAQDMAGTVFYVRMKNPGWKFSMRMLEENGVKGTRIWRTK